MVYYTAVSLYSLQHGREYFWSMGTFRELENGMTWNPLFERKCVQPLKCIADTHTDLFEDLITIFSGVSLTVYLLLIYR